MPGVASDCPRQIFQRRPRESPLQRRKLQFFYDTYQELYFQDFSLWPSGRYSMGSAGQTGGCEKATEA